MPVFTILPTVVDMLADELQGQPSYKTLPCPRCDAAIPLMISTCASLPVTRALNAATT